MDSLKSVVGLGQPEGGGLLGEMDEQCTLSKTNVRGARSPSRPGRVRLRGRLNVGESTATASPSLLAQRMIGFGICFTLGFVLSFIVRATGGRRARVAAAGGRGSQPSVPASARRRWRLGTPFPRTPRRISRTPPRCARRNRVSSFVSASQSPFLLLTNITQFAILYSFGNIIAMCSCVAPPPLRRTRAPLPHSLTTCVLCLWVCVCLLPSGAFLACAARCS